MGWKSTLRSVQAGMRNAEKQDQRYRKQQAKIQQKKNAITTLNTQESYIDRITKIHTSSSVRGIDWRSIAIQPAPIEPKYSNHYESEAKHKYTSFKPSFFHKFFRLIERKKRILSQKIEQSAKKDHEEYHTALKIYKKEYAEWENNHYLAKQLLEKNPKAITNTIAKLNTFKKIENLCKGIKFSVDSNLELIVDITVKNDEIIPKEKYSIRQSGTLSTKDMPKNEANTLYQDYVCSCILYVAAELFCTLPIEQILINANGNLLNSTTGHLEDQTILSTLIVKKTFLDLNLSSLDPSDSMKNFLHNMKFKKTIGFEPVIPLILPEVTETPNCQMSI